MTVKVDLNQTEATFQRPWLWRNTLDLWPALDTYNPFGGIFQRLPIHRLQSSVQEEGICFLAIESRTRFKRQPGLCVIPTTYPLHVGPAQNRMWTAYRRHRGIKVNDQCLHRSKLLGIDGSIHPCFRFSSNLSSKCRRQSWQPGKRGCPCGTGSGRLRRRGGDHSTSDVENENDDDQQCGENVQAVLV